MPKRTPNEDEKEMKPKQIAKIVLDVYDNGYVLKKLKEYYTDEEVKKRITFDHDSVKEFKQCFRELLTDEPDFYVVNELLKALDISPRRFAQKTLGLPIEAEKTDPQ